ncbi:MAG: PEP/pyruvate-binding domain-containing protein [Proteobacteria bacterium]|nr:PEP/pyruvate-binding domain-containing protein [Pseudomonadota bacterium]
MGRKCANLGDMTRAGFRVPQGFALSLEAYKRFLETSGAQDQIHKYLASFKADAQDLSDLSKWQEASDALRAIVESMPMPADMGQTISSYYRDLSRRCVTDHCPVATRSAGATSHPGQYETFLHVRGEAEVLRHIIRVWASTFNQRSLVARARANLPLDADPIGVAVLQMVNARAAGVLFTLNPANGDRSKIAIGANWGLGESVVSGSVTPDEWMVDKVVLEINKRTVVPKPQMYVVVSAGGREEVAMCEVPPDRQCIPCLSDEEIIELARISKEIERHYGTPQDIEWAVDAERVFPDNIFILQARPESAWRDRPKVSLLADSDTPARQVLSYLVNIKA